MTLKLKDLPSYVSDGLDEDERLLADRILGQADKYLTDNVKKYTTWKAVALLVAGFLPGLLAGLFVPRSANEESTKPAAAATAAPISAPTPAASSSSALAEPQPLPEVPTLPEGPKAPPTDARDESVRGQDAYNGEWVSVDGKALPVVKILKGLTCFDQPSKTPYNVCVRAEDGLTAGCGFYPDTGTAICKVHDKDNKAVPKSMTTHVDYVDVGDVLGEQILLSIEDVGSFLVKFKGKYVPPAKAK